MTHVTCRLSAKNRDQLRNATLGNRVLATFTFYLYLVHTARPDATGCLVASHELGVRRNGTCRGKPSNGHELHSPKIREVWHVVFEIFSRADRHTDTPIAILRTATESDVIAVILTEHNS